MTEHAEQEVLVAIVTEGIHLSRGIFCPVEEQGMLRLQAVSSCRLLHCQAIKAALLVVQQSESAVRIGVFVFTAMKIRCVQGAAVQSHGPKVVVGQGLNYSFFGRDGRHAVGVHVFESHRSPDVQDR